MSQAKFLRFCAISVAAIIGLAHPVFAQSVTFKFATLAPRGTVWATEMGKMIKQIENDTNGAVKVKVYYGGSKGSEKNMIRLMKSGSLDGAAFTGVGLGQILKETAVLQLPMFYTNNAQVDKVRKGLTPHFEKAFRTKGFELVGWGEVGWLYFFSKTKVAEIDDFDGMKIWSPEGDELVKTMLAEIDVVPYQHPIQAVYGKLQTNAIDGVVNSTSGLVGLQWHNHVKYVALQKLTVGAGGTLMSNAAFKRVPAAHRAKVKKIISESSDALIKKIRYMNKRHVKTIMKSGIKGVKLSADSIATLKKKSLIVQNKLVGKLYSKALLNKARALR